MPQLDTIASAQEDASPPPPPEPDTVLTPLPEAGYSTRAQLVRKLSDVIALPQDRVSTNERSLVADMLLQITDTVEVELRVEVAERVGRVAEAPTALVRMLLLDEPAVAEKIILGQAQVAEALLIECARRGAVEHRRLIASRRDLTTATADAIVSFREVEPAKHVLRREDCPLSPLSMDILVAMSATHAALQPLIMRRTELDPAHGFMMFWWVDNERRRRIMSRFALDRRVIQDALADLYPIVMQSADPDPLVKEILTLADRRHRPRGLNGQQISMDVVAKTLGVARNNDTQEAADAVGMVAGIKTELAARILRDPGGEPFAVLCKGFGISRNTFSKYYDRERLNDEGRAKADYLLACFDSISRDFARAVIRYWDWDGNPRIANTSRLMAEVDGARAELPS